MGMVVGWLILPGRLIHMIRFESGTAHQFQGEAWQWLPRSGVTGNARFRWMEERPPSRPFSFLRASASFASQPGR